MPSMYLLPLAASLAALTCLAAWKTKIVLGATSARRRAAERVEVFRQLSGKVEAGARQARFSYRPATGELVMDAEAARLHGLDLAKTENGAEITLAGWYQLPAAARVAGRIDEALADGLSRRETVSCEYLARLAGWPDRSMKLVAMPVARTGLLVGLLQERRRA